MPRPTVALFDIDGTLLTAAGAGRRAIDRAIALECGVADAMEGVDLAGRTDPWIVRTALTKRGLPNDDAMVGRVLDGYVEFLSEEIQKVQARAHGGVTSLLEALSGRARLAMGLGTGNLERSAHVKLSAVALSHHFSFGGFSSDHEERDKLLEVGAQRGAAQLQMSRAQCAVVVIGDTPHDVTAAKAIGATCIAVATGRHTEAELHDTAADLVVASLDRDDVVRAIVGE